MAKEKQEKSEIEILQEQQLEICDDLDEILHREYSPEHLKEISELQERNKHTPIAEKKKK